VRIKGRPAIRKRHQSKHLDLTIPAFEAEGREFESLRAHQPSSSGYPNISGNGVLFASALRCMPAKGFSIRMSGIRCPPLKSSERIRVAPLLAAVKIIKASQKSIRDSSSMRNAAEISVGVVSMHQIA
jgi:hypothetical protein